MAASASPCPVLKGKIKDKYGCTPYVSSGSSYVLYRFGTLWEWLEPRYSCLAALGALAPKLVGVVSENGK